MKNILITGATGFIGTYLLKYLKQKGFTPGTLSRSVPGYLAELFTGVDSYLTDLSEPVEVELRKSYDVLIHLAAANDVDSKDPERALRGTVLTTKRMLDFAVENNIKKVIYFSTYQVYGSASRTLSESSSLSCENDYALTHFFAEEYLRMYAQKSELTFIIVRGGNIYGGFIHPQIDRWTLVPNCFILECAEKDRIKLRSSGKQTRDFLSLHDVCQALLLLANNFESHSNEIFNVASGKQISILEIAQIVRDVYNKRNGKSAEIVIQNPSTKENHIGFDISKLKRLGFKVTPEYSLEKEIEKIFSLLADYDS